MSIKLEVSSKTVLLVAVIFLTLVSALIVSATFNPQAPWHPLGQVKAGTGGLDDNPVDNKVDLGFIPQGHGSGLDADTLDGLHADEILLQGTPSASKIPVYQIKSTVATFTGNIGGRVVANQACVTEFGAGAMMYGSQHIKQCLAFGNCFIDYRVTTESWFDWITTFYDQSASGSISDGLPKSWQHTVHNCNGWLDSSALTKGYSLRRSGEPRAAGTLIGCDSLFPIACAIPQ